VKQRACEMERCLKYTSIDPDHYEKDFTDLFELNKVISPDETEEDFKKYFSSFNSFFVKASIENKIVGFASIMYPFWNKVGVIHHLIVKPEYRKKGIATELLKLILSEAQNKKLRIVTVQTADWNNEAISVYLKLNFIRKASFKDYYGERNNLCWLELNLNEPRHPIVLQSEIETDRLILRPLNMDMVDDIFQYAQIPIVSRYVPWEPHKTIQDTKDFIATMKLNHSNHEGKIFFVWGIINQNTGKTIGTIDFKQPSPHIGQIDYALSPDYWRKGIMTEAAKGVLSWAKQQLPEVKRYQSFSVAENIGSIKVMEKIGLRFEGIRRKQIFFKNEFKDMAYCAAVDNFELQPNLPGNLVQIRPLKKEDFEPLYAVASDPLIWELHPEKERYRRDVFQKYFDGAIQSAGAVVIEDKNGNIIGASRYYDYNFHQSQVTIGYTFLGRKYWGGQFNREVKKLMLNHAFRFVDRVVFEIGEKNLRSRRAIEKIGAKMIQSEHLGKANQVVYQITREEFNF